MRTSGPTWRHCERDLDRIDGWIADGVIGGPEPNAADYQLAPSLRLLMSFDDLRPLRRGEALRRDGDADRPGLPGRTPPVFPSEWLDRL